jgi:hypothetical protein
MVAKTRASDSTGHHCGQVNPRTWGRPTASSTTPATHWRTATTPAGPITGRASAPVAAPTWLNRALPSIRATTGHTRLRIGHAWSAMGRHTPEFQRRWAAMYPDVELQLIRTNSGTGGLAEGLCDLAVVRTPPTSATPPPSPSASYLGAATTLTRPPTPPWPS